MDVFTLAVQGHSALLEIATMASGGVLILAAATALTLSAGRAVSPLIRALVDWLVIATVLGIGVAGVLGLTLLAATGGPRDGLHAVYGVVALLTLPLARMLGAGPPQSTDGRPWQEPHEPQGVPTVRSVAWLAGGAFVTIGVLLRLSETG